MPSSKFHLAIDGPVAAGCSTVARLTAAQMGFLYIDTGAMYRVAALLALRNKVDPDDEDKVAALVKNAHIEMHEPTAAEQDGRVISVLVNSEDVSWEIRTDEISKLSAVVAQHPQVREILVKKQQQIAQNKSVVMEGRDITYKVLPDADLKIYLTADEVVRAQRRHKQELSQGRQVTFQEVYDELKVRDKKDQERAVDPLKIVDDALIIDTSDLSPEQIANTISSKISSMVKADG